MSAKLNQKSTISDLNNAITRCTISFITDITEIWAKIGIEGDMMESRKESVIQHIQDIMNEMVTEEKNLFAKIQNQITTFQQSVQELEKELELRPKIISKDTLLNFQNNLKIYVEELTARKQERLNGFAELNAQEKTLIEQLGLQQAVTCVEGLPSQNFLDKYAKKVDEMKAELMSREEQFNRDRTRLMELMEQLETAPETDFEFEILGRDSYVVSKTNLEKITMIIMKMEKEVETNKAASKELYNQIQVLWQKLDIEDDYRTQFQDRVKGFLPSVIQKLKNELARLTVMKLENIATFLEKVRANLHELWGECMFGEKQKEEFGDLLRAEPSEEVLEEHEKEITKWKNYLQVNGQLIADIKHHGALFDDMVNLENKANDPARLFMNRGGELLLEEKKRNQVAKELPKVENKLRAKLQQWEQNHGKPFVVNDMPYMTVMDQRRTDFEAEKENLRAKRQQEKNQLKEETQSATRSTKRKMDTPSAASRSKLHKADMTPRKTPQTLPRRGGMGRTLPTTKDCNASQLVAASYADFSRQLEKRSKTTICRSSTVSTAAAHAATPTKVTPGPRTPRVVRSARRTPTSTAKLGTTKPFLV